jgi:hypothetical protein
MPKPRIAGYNRESTDTDVISTKSSISKDDDEQLEDEKFPMCDSFNSKTSENKGEKSLLSSDVERIDSLDDSETDAKAAHFYIGESSRNVIVRSIETQETVNEMEKSIGELPIDKSEIEVSEKLSRQHSKEEEDEDKLALVTNVPRLVEHSPVKQVKNFELEKPVEIIQEDVTFAKASSIEVVLDKSMKDHFRLETSPSKRTEEEIVFEKTLEEVEDSLDAVQEKLIEVVKDGKLIKQSPSEFEIKILPDLKYPASIPEQEETPNTPKKDSKSPNKINETSTTITTTTTTLKSENEDSQHSSNDDSKGGKYDVVVIRHKNVVDFNETGSNRCSATDIESSSESHYQSFEKTDSRPMSSDVENVVLRSYQSSEYETAQDRSLHPGSSTLEYHSAVSTLSSNSNPISSRDSMRSLDSESSGNLASLETNSDISETLVPSTMEEYEEVVTTHSLTLVEHEYNVENDNDEKDNINTYSSLPINITDVKKEDTSSISSVMKRSHEMTFVPDIKPFVDSVDILDDSNKYDDKLAKSVEDLKYGSWEEHRFGSSLEEGSMLSVSISSASNLETMVEVQGESADLMGSIVGSYDSGKIYSFSDEPVFMSSSFDTQQQITTQMDSEKSIHHQYNEGEQSMEQEQETGISQTSVEEMKKRGHKRTDSTTVYPGNFIKVESKESSDSFEDDIVLQEDSSDVISSERDETHGESSDSEFDRFETEYSRAFKSPMSTPGGKSSKSSSSVKDDDKKSFSPGHSIIETIVEDVNAEHAECELSLEHDMKTKTTTKHKIHDNDIPNIQVTEDVSSSSFSPPLEQQQQQQQQQKIYEEKKDDKTKKPSAAIVEDIKYAKQSEYKMSEDEYHNLIEQKYKARFEELSKLRNNDDILYDENNQQLSPVGSDSFEMLNEPDLSDEFVIVEEVAKEAHEFDKEGKSVSIQSSSSSTTKKYVRKHDEEMEQYIIKSAPANTDAGSQMVATNLNFEFEESPPQDDDNPEPLRGSGYALEGSKRWVEMNLSDTANMRYPYELDRGVLEDIKEEENEMEVGSSRISSFKDSYSSTPDYDALVRKLHTSRGGAENDTISMNSLQEFESLEQVISLENRRQQTQSSQESLSTGSYPKRQIAKSLQGDDISLSSLGEFEGLENACLEAHLIEIRAKEEAALLLSRSDDSSKSSGSSNGNKSSPKVSSTPASSSSSKVTTVTTTTTVSASSKGGVKQFTHLEQQMAQEFAKLQQRAQEIMGDESINIMETSTDSLEDNKKVSKLVYDKTSSQHVSNDSLDNNSKAVDPMTSSIDSIENARGIIDSSKRTKESDSDSLENNSPVKRTRSDSIDSIELQLQMSKGEGLNQGKLVSFGNEITMRNDDDDGRKVVVMSQTTIKGTTFTTSVSNDSLQQRSEPADLLLTSTESLETNSTATNATYRNNDSQMSGSMTSCDSNTMIDTLDNFHAHTTSYSSHQIFQTTSTSYATEKENILDDDDDKFMNIPKN